MIIVNVKVPALEKVYNFSLEEKAQISELIEELALLVYQKEGLPLENDPKESFRELSLCAPDAGGQLDHGCALADYGIRDGSELILV